MSVTGTELGLSAGIEDFLSRCEAVWPNDQSPPAILARAPGRLDCMGGMADFSGALALQMPIEQGVYLAAGRRDDQKISVTSTGFSNNGETAHHEWPLSTFYQSDGQVVTAADLAPQFESAAWVRHVAGVFLALLESGDVPHFAGGVTIVFQSAIPQRAGLASSAAIEVATAMAVSGLFQAQLEPRAILSACRTASQEFVGDSTGLVDHLTCLLGEQDILLQIRCQPDDVLGPVNLPKGLRMVGVDCGLRLPIYEQRYEDNRVASMMGRYLIERIVRASGEPGDPSGGYLANISPNEYVRRFRNELPVKVKGKDFFARFGGNEELESMVVPDRIYKIRSRTEHHIYENDRTHRLMERLSRARRTGEREAILEAGELMYASHWSYGQRCGMGSIETDVLVNLIRQMGPDQGLYGAKATAGGCGGTVAVMLDDDDQAFAALEEAVKQYQAKTGKRSQVLSGSSPGALAFGTRSLDQG